MESLSNTSAGCHPAASPAVQATDRLGTVPVTAVPANTSAWPGSSAAELERQPSARHIKLKSIPGNQALYHWPLTVACAAAQQQS